MDSRFRHQSGHMALDRIELIKTASHKLLIALVISVVTL